MSQFRNLVPHAGLSGVATVLLAAGTAFGDLRLDVVANPDPPRPGELLDVEFTVTNDGAFDLTDLTLVFDYPAGLEALRESWFEGDCPSTFCEPGEQAVFTLATLSAGKGVTFSVPARVDDATADGTPIPFDVRVFDDGIVEVSAAAEVTVDGGREIDLALAEGDDPVVPGRTLRYTLAFGVSDTSPGSPGATLRFPLPSGTTFVSADGGGTESKGVVAWALGNLNPGTGGERTVTVAVDDGLDPGVIVAAAATYEDTAGNVVTHEASTRVQADIPLALAVVASPDPARPGETLDVEITVTNTGPFDRTGVQVRLEVPDYVAPLSEVFFDGDCASTFCEPQERAVFDVDTLAAGRGRTFSLPFRIDGSTIDGTVLAFEAEVRDSTGDQREQGTPLRVASDRELELALVADRDPAATGEVIAYSVAYGVIEASGGAPGATLALRLPEGTTFLEASDGGVEAGGVVTWSVGSLNPGMSGKRTATVRVDEDRAAGSILSAAAVLVDATDRPLRYDLSTRVQDETSLQLTMIASPDPAQPGETLDAELTVTNTGPFDRTGVVLRLEVPDGFEALSEVFFDGDCPSTFCEARERVVFDIGTVPAGDGVTFSVPFRVAATTVDGTAIALEADLTDSPGDRRCTGATLTVEDERQLDLALVESDEPIVDPAWITYTLSYATAADGPGVPGGTLGFELAPGTVFESASPGAQVSGDRVEWPVGSLDPGAGGEHDVTVSLAEGTPVGTILPAIARFEDQSSPAGAVRFAESTRTQAGAPLDVELTVFPNPALPGATLTVRLEVTNTTGLDRTDVALRLEFPDGLAPLAETEFDGDCPSTFCEARERAVFSLPVVRAGETVTFLAPPRIAGATPAGTVINFDVLATDSTGFTAWDGDAIMVGSDFDRIDGDANRDGIVDVIDLLRVLADWGPCADPDACPEDFNSDGILDVADLLRVLARWG